MDPITLSIVGAGAYAWWKSKHPAVAPVDTTPYGDADITARIAAAHGTWEADALASVEHKDYAAAIQVLYRAGLPADAHFVAVISDTGGGGWGGTRCECFRAPCDCGGTIAVDPNPSDHTTWGDWTPGGVAPAGAIAAGLPPGSTFVRDLTTGGNSITMDMWSDQQLWQAPSGQRFIVTKRGHDGINYSYSVVPDGTSQAVSVWQRSGSVLTERWTSPTQGDFYVLVGGDNSVRVSRSPTGGGGWLDAPIYPVRPMPINYGSPVAIDPSAGVVNPSPITVQPPVVYQTPIVIVPPPLSTAPVVAPKPLTPIVTDEPVYPAAPYDWAANNTG